MQGDELEAPRGSWVENSSGRFRNLFMETIVRWTDPPIPCGYRPDHTCRRDNMYVAKLDADEYMAHLLGGWRRFGYTLFRQNCTGPGACRSLRVDVARFRPDRSQRRARKANDGVVQLRIGIPAVTPEKVALLDRFHADRSVTRDWPPHDPDDAEQYARSFVLNPFPTQEWCYFLDGLLVGVGYVDHLPGGLSAIYFSHDPRFRDRSLGTWNVLSLIDRAAVLGLPHVYLGYFAPGCPSLQYKGRFRPYQSLDPDDGWCDPTT